MPTDATDTALATTGVDARRYDRYAAVELADGRTIVYDIEAEDGWVQSDHAVALEDLR